MLLLLFCLHLCGLVFVSNDIILMLFTWLLFLGYLLLLFLVSLFLQLSLLLFLLLLLLLFFVLLLLVLMENVFGFDAACRAYCLVAAHFSPHIFYYRY